MKPIQRQQIKTNPSVKFVMMIALIGRADTETLLPCLNGEELLKDSMKSQIAC